MADHTADSYLFEDVFAKPVTARFDGERRTSDAGLTLLSAVDRRLRFTRQLAACLEDQRDPSRVLHTKQVLFQQRVFSIALGCADGNDAALMGNDPALLLACDRRSDDPRGLGSQPTLSRFEHSVTGRELVELQDQMEDFVVNRLFMRHRHPRRIFIDLDPSVDPTHGQQEFAFFNGHYGTWCFLPMLGFLSVPGDPEQYLFHARLRAGTVKEVKGTPLLLRRIVAKLRRRYPRTRICVRLDAGFAYPQIFDCLEDLGLEYMVAMGGNRALDRLAERHMYAARSFTKRFEQTTTLFGEGHYKTRTWGEARRVIFKAEVLRAEDKLDRDNARYVVTNLKGSPEAIWNLYCKRGDSENRIKELKNDLEIDRTSCSRFLANQLRVTMTAAAFVLFQELRAALAGTELARSMVATLRLRLVKIGATITESVRRIVISMPRGHPWKDAWRLAAGRVAILA